MSGFVFTPKSIPVYTPIGKSIYKDYPSVSVDMSTPVLLAVGHPGSGKTNLVDLLVEGATNHGIDTLLIDVMGNIQLKADKLLPNTLTVIRRGVSESIEQFEERLRPVLLDELVMVARAYPDSSAKKFIIIDGFDGLDSEETLIDPYKNSTIIKALVNLSRAANGLMTVMLTGYSVDTISKDISSEATTIVMEPKGKNSLPRSWTDLGGEAVLELLYDLDDYSLSASSTPRRRQFWTALLRVGQTLVPVQVDMATQQF